MVRKDYTTILKPNCKQIVNTAKKQQKDIAICTPLSYNMTRKAEGKPLIERK